MKTKSIKGNAALKAVEMPEAHAELARATNGNLEMHRLTACC